MDPSWIYKWIVGVITFTHRGLNHSTCNWWQVLPDQQDPSEDLAVLTDFFLVRHQSWLTFGGKHISKNGEKHTSSEISSSIFETIAIWSQWFVLYFPILNEERFSTPQKKSQGRFEASISCCFTWVGGPRFPVWEPIIECRKCSIMISLYTWHDFGSAFPWMVGGWKLSQWIPGEVTISLQSATKSS